MNHLRAELARPNAVIQGGKLAKRDDQVDREREFKVVLTIPHFGKADGRYRYAHDVLRIVRSLIGKNTTGMLTYEDRGVIKSRQIETDDEEWAKIRAKVEDELAMQPYLTPREHNQRDLAEAYTNLADLVEAFLSHPTTLAQERLTHGLAKVRRAQLGLTTSPPIPFT